MPHYLSPGTTHSVPRVLAHRGLAVAALENTAAAFAAALDAGAIFIETDVQVSADGVAVLWHDPDLRRFDGSRTNIAATTWAELQLRTGPGAEPLQTLESALSQFPTARLNIDLKVEPALEPVIQAVTAAAATERVLLTSFTDARRRRAATRLSGVATSTGMSAVILCVLAQALPQRARNRLWQRALSGAVALQVPRRYAGLPIVTRRFVRIAHEQQVEVHVWTVNEPQQMQQLVALGVDGIVTDRADIAMSVLHN